MADRAGIRGCAKAAGVRLAPKLARPARRPDGGELTFGAPVATTAAEAAPSARAEAAGRSVYAEDASVKQNYENVIAIFRTIGYAPTIGPPGRSPAMPDPAAPAASVSAAGREVRRHGGRRTRRDRPAAARARPVRPLPQCGPPPPPLDEEDEGAAKFDARLDDLLRRVAEDKARAAAARGGRTAARRRAPRGFQFACNPLILLDRPQNVFPNVSKTKGFVGRRDPGRRRARGAGRRRAADPRGLQFACNSLICLDRARNPFPNIAAPKGFVGRGGAQPSTWVVQAREAGRGGKRAKG